LEDSDTGETFIGKEAERRKNRLTLKYPVEHGIISDWDTMEQIWDHIFQHELKLKPEDCSVLLTEFYNNPKHCREKITEMMFETFLTPSMYLGLHPVLALYASGRTSGLVLDSGYSITNIVPVYDSYCVPKGHQTINFGGKHLTDYMAKLLTDRRLPFITTELADDMKESLCFTAIDYDVEMKKATESTVLDKTFELLDGRLIAVAKERIMCPEAMFSPSLDVLNAGISSKVLRSIRSCDSSIRNSITHNIIVAGGNTMFEGFPKRLKTELTALDSNLSDINVERASENGQYSTFKGGSLFASLSSFKELKITKAEYEDIGPKSVHHKCY